MDRALHTFEEVNTHKALNTNFTAFTEILRLLLIKIFADLTWQYVCCRCIDRQLQFGKKFKNFFVVDSILKCGQFWTQGNRFISSWEITNIGHIIVSLNMLSRPGNRYTVQHLKEIEIQL